MEIVKIRDMKNLNKLVIAIAMISASFNMSAQKKSDSEGLLTYSLPSTTIILEVEAEQESFFAGPYAEYAEKYLGIKVREKDETAFKITQIRMTPLLEADQSRRYSLNVKKGQLDGSFLKLSSTGLISFSDAKFGEQPEWRFPSEGQGGFSGKGVSSALTSESTTLYRSGDKAEIYDKVSVEQDMLVEKSLEQRAAETAEMILKLRKQRLQIVTGDTDATYSGEAMGAAIAELTRLEDEYMKMFVGVSDKHVQKMRFEVVPEQNRENQIYVAFRMSDTAGLVPADNLSGKPVVMEIIPQDFSIPEVSEDMEKSKKDILVRYRIPSICTVRLTDGMNLLLQSRIPIYQLGQESSMPVNVILK